MNAVKVVSVRNGVRPRSVTGPRAVIGDGFLTRGIARADEVRRMRHEVVSFVELTGAPQRVVDAVRSAVSEALTNAVMHAYLGRASGSMEVKAWYERNHLVVRVCDEGHGLIPRADSPGLGVGIALMASLADDFRIGNREGTPGTIVSLRFSLAD